LYYLFSGQKQDGMIIVTEGVWLAMCSTFILPPKLAQSFSSNWCQKQYQNDDYYTNPEHVLIPSCADVSSMHCANADWGNFFYRQTRQTKCIQLYKHLQLHTMPRNFWMIKDLQFFMNHFVIFKVIIFPTI